MYEFENDPFEEPQHGGGPDLSDDRPSESELRRGRRRSPRRIVRRPPKRAAARRRRTSAFVKVPRRAVVRSRLRPRGRPRPLHVPPRLRLPRRRFPRGPIFLTRPLPIYRSPLVRRAQECLFDVIGKPLKHDGVMDLRTRRAVRTFQRSRRLPNTGILDKRTLAELFNACIEHDRDRPDWDPSPPPLPAGTDDELLTGPSNFELFAPEKVTVRLKRHGPAALKSLTGREPDIRKPGLYVVRLNGKPWYVGMATRTIYGRFVSRAAAIRQLQGVEQKALQGDLEWYVLQPGSWASVRRGKGSRQRRLTGKEAPLRLAEQLFIRRLRPEGNGNREAVRFLNTGALTILISHNGVIQRIKRGSDIV